jgi:hypothetical protein
MLWKQRRSYAGVFIEQLLVTVVLMLALVSVVESVKKYRTPGMLNTENVFHTFYTSNLPSEDSDKIKQSWDVIIGNLRKLPFVEAISNSNNLSPYTRNDEYYLMQSDSMHIDDRHFIAVLKFSDEFGATVFKPEMEEGTWLENRALPDGSIPVVITRQFADEAGWTVAKGKKIIRSNIYTVVGVAAGLKQEPFKPSPAAIVKPYYMDYSSMSAESMVRIKPGYDREFIDAFYKEYQRLISDERVESSLNDMHTLKGLWISMSILGVALQSIPTAFLFIFAFIGTFGLSWMISKRRIREFALRIALGSTKSRLMTIVIGESLLITGIAVIPAMILSFFIYDYTAVHIIGTGVTVLIMLLFSAVSAWYPAWKASKVNPAEALKYE